MMRSGKWAVLMLLATSCGMGGAGAAGQPIWQLGTPDKDYAEFALAPEGYAAFLEKDFGWPDRCFVIGLSDPKMDWPYVLPGPDDAWAGSGGLAGIRTQQLELLFDLAARPEGAYVLIVEAVDVHPEAPPLLRARINGAPFDMHLKPGGAVESIAGQPALGRPASIRFDQIPIRAGVNHLSLTILQGSWLLFDSLRLEGPEGAALAPPKETLIRSVDVADYHIKAESGEAQPLLLDLYQRQGSAAVEVLLGETPILSRTISAGRTIFEAPMPAVAAPEETGVRVLIDGVEGYTGPVARAPQSLRSPADYVDMFMGTGHSRWMIAPGPWMPYGMVKLSPNNQDSGWQGGYDPTIESISSFSHIHEWTMAGLGMLPTTGPLQIEAGGQYAPDAGYRSRIDKESEQGGIGYYSVQLTDYDIRAELTATTRAGMQRYTFPPAAEARVLIDLQIPAEYRFDVDACQIEKVSAHRVEGFSKQHSNRVWGGIKQDYIVHFVIDFDTPMAGFGVWRNRKIMRDTDRLETRRVPDAGAFAEFDLKTGGVVQARSAISLVSIEGARKNLEAEILPFGWDFEAVRAAQRSAWNRIFERIEIETPDYRDKVRFYSNLYRAYCPRTIWSDVDGQWIGPYEKVHQLPDPASPVFGCDAFWNTFWNLNQVWNLLTPAYSAQWVRSQLALYDAAGWLAKGPAGMEYIPVMVAEHEIPFIVAAWQLGIRDFDAEKAFEAMIKMQTEEWDQNIDGGQAGNKDLKVYLELGYVPHGGGKSSNTMEYAYDDFCVAQMAKALGKEDRHQEFMARSKSWKRLIDPEIGAARPKDAAGNWIEPYQPLQRVEGWTEGNAWQYTWFVPQNPLELIDYIGKERFVQSLNEGFVKSEPLRYNAPLEQYWDYPVCHGNQPAMQVSYLFNYAGMPWLTQQWNRSIQDRYYGYGVGDAYLGDEDQGQMSAWFVMSAIGLFQMDGGCRVDPIYEIASPRFDKVTIHLDERYYPGGAFVIETRNASKANAWVQSATLNGEALNRWWFPAKALQAGGTLVVEMGPRPNKSWAAGEAALPPRPDAS